MDRRQIKSRRAIFSAFTHLLSKKNYNKITVQEIIDEADVGRATFYNNFDTKDSLLEEMCRELFGHIVDRAFDASHTHGLYIEGGKPESIFCHLLQHLSENDNNILVLLGCENSEIFFKYFKESLNKLVKMYISNCTERKNPNVPDDFLVNHISGSFVEMVLWWIKGKMKETPETLDRYFSSVIEPVI